MLNNYRSYESLFEKSDARPLTHFPSELAAVFGVRRFDGAFKAPKDSRPGVRCEPEICRQGDLPSLVRGG